MQQGSLRARLTLALSNDNPEDMERLLTEWCYPEALNRAVQVGAVKCTRWLLQHGWDPSEPSLFQERTPLLAALTSTTLSQETLECIVSLLCEFGVSLNAPLRVWNTPGTQSWMWSPLYVAYNFGCHRMVWTMLLRGARLLKDERYPLSGGIQELERVYRRRADRCRAVCIILLACAPFHQKCLRRDWVRRYVWTRRHEEKWAPELELPFPFGAAIYRH